jgi:hypothetical protein
LAKRISQKVKFMLLGLKGQCRELVYLVANPSSVRLSLVMLFYTLVFLLYVWSVEVLPILASARMGWGRS